MRKSTVAILALLVVASFALAAPALAGGKKSRRGASRVDFDDALIKGQTNRGAVHLIERKDSNLGSLVKKRTNYRKEILAPYGYQTEVGLEREDTDEEAEAQPTAKVIRKKPAKPVASKAGEPARRRK